MAILEAPAFVAGLDDVAMMGEAVEQRGGHLGVTEDRGPLAEGEIGGNDDRGALIESADEVEEQLAAGLGEGQITELIEDGEVEPGQMISDSALSARASLGLELVDQIDDVVEAPPGAGTDAAASDCDGKVGFATAGAADSTMLRCWVMKPPAARSLTKAALIGVSSKTKSLKSLARGNLAMVS